MNSATGDTLAMYMDKKPRAPQNQPKREKKSGLSSIFNCCSASTAQRSDSSGLKGTTRPLAPRAHRHLSHDKKRVIDHSIGGVSTINALTPQKKQPEPEPEPGPARRVLLR